MNGANVLEHLVDVGGAVWRASWQASVLAVLVVAVQLIFGRRITARWRHAMWMLVFVRLALPVVPSSPMSVFNLAPAKAPANAPGRATVAYTGDVSMQAPVAPMPTAVDSTALLTGSRVHGPSTAKPQAAVIAQRALPDRWAGWPQVLALLWAAGALLLTLRIAWGTWRVSRTLRRLARVDADAVQQILQSSGRELGVRRLPTLLAGDGMFSPALVGFLRPRLLLPRDLLSGFDPAELRLIFLHELAHLKRRDVAINWAATLLCALHWMNPIAWLAAWRLRLERELACDELVMTATSDTDRRAYGHTIVKLLETISRGGDGHSGVAGIRPARPLPAGGVGILEGKEQMKRRITMIAQFARSTRPWTIVAAVIVVTLGLVALTDAVQADEPVKLATEPAIRQRTMRLTDGSVVATDEYARDERTKATTQPLTDFQRFLNAVGERVIAERTIRDASGAVLNAEEVNQLAAAERGRVLRLYQAAAAAGKVGWSLSDAAEIAKTDATMQKHLAELAALETRRKEVASINENHPDISPLDQEIELTKNAIYLLTLENRAKLQAETPTNEELAQIDPTMREYLRSLNQLEAERQALKVGEKHPSVLAVEARIKETKDFIEKIGDQARKRWAQPTKLKVGDLVAVSILDVAGEGVETAKTARVDGDGTINLPYVGQIKASGLTPRELEKAVAKALQDANFVVNATVAVSLPERGESHQLGRPRATEERTRRQAPNGMEEVAPVPALLDPEAPAPLDPAASALLERKLPEVKFDQIPFAEVIDFLRDVTGSNISVDWRQLEEAGLERNVPVTLRLRDVALKDMLSIMLRDLGHGLQYKVEGGVIQITTSGQRPPGKLVTRAYEVGDLLIPTRDEQQPGLFGDDGAGARSAAATRLSNTIFETVQPESWRSQGGKGTLSSYGTKIIVSATEDVHHEVASLLEMLREKPATQPATRVEKLLGEVVQ